MLVRLTVLLAVAAQTASAVGADALRLDLAPGPLALAAPARQQSHVEALGEQAGLWGSLRDGFEAWAYPFKLLDGLTLRISTNGGRTFADVRLRAVRQIAAPHFAQLEFADADWHLGVTFFVPRSLPGVLLLLKADARRDLDLALRFRPVLAPMHLTAKEPLQISWAAARKEVCVREPGRELELRLGSPHATSCQAVEKDVQEIRLRLPANRAPQCYMPVAASLGYPESPDAQVVLERLLTNAPQLIAEAAAHYTELLARSPRVESPDPDVNSALAWSAVSLDQLRVRNPYLGYGLVSGYSRSGAGTRPKYCWFFEEPTLTSCAYHWVGQSAHVREALRFLQRWQRDDGKTVHEIVQSLPFWTNYFQEFRYAYMHSDGPVYYLFAYGHYFQRTGDFGFIREEWPRIRRTLAWCLTAMDPADGLIRIEPGDWGSAESSTGVWKDTQLQGMWVRALRDVNELARRMGEPALADRCAQAAAQAGAALEAKLWDAAAGTYLWGLDRQGRPLKSLVPHHAVSFWLGSLRPGRVRQALERMAAADFRTDWGVRSLALSDPQYRPQNYQAGSVWPVWNAGVIVSEYRHQRGGEAFRNWRAMVAARTLDGLGPMPEVLDGRVFQRLDDGVPHQMFSELAIVNGFFDGLLGLRVDAPAGRLGIAPCLPPIWPQLKVERIPCGPGTLDLNIERTGTNYDLGFRLNWPAAVAVQLAPQLPAGARILSVQLDGREVAHQTDVRPEATRVTLEVQLPPGQHALRIRQQDGIECLPVDAPLVRGAASRNVRIIRAGLDGPMWRMTLEGLPGTAYPIEFFTSRPMPGPATEFSPERTESGFRVTVTAPATAATNAAGFVRWASRLPLSSGSESSH